MPIAWYRSQRTRDSWAESRSHLFRISTRGILSISSERKIVSTAVICRSIFLAVASTTCRSMSASRSSSRVVRKAPTKSFGEIPDEPHRIGHDDFAIVRKSETTARGVERFEEAILGRDLAMSQGIKQGGFPRIGVPDDGEYGKRLAETSGSALILMAGDIVNVSLQMRDAVADAATIRFEFGFTRTRVPIPPPRRDNDAPCPESRGSRYRSCASSTCTLPSRVWARRANISRMSWVRSMTLRSVTSEMARACAGASPDRRSPGRLPFEAHASRLL